MDQPEVKIHFPDILWPSWGVIVKLSDDLVTFTSDGGMSDVGISARELRDWLIANMKN